MMNDALKGDIKLYFPDGSPDAEWISSRISLSAGTVEALSSHLRYVENARVPAPDWRRLSTRETEQLVSPKPLQRGFCVALTQLLPQRELGQVQANLRAARARFDDPRKLNTQLLDLVVTSLKSICSVCEVSNVFGLNIDPANLETTSINRQLGVYAGLHIDVWEDKALEGRHLCANRVSINLGPSHRYFLFVCYSAAEMKSALMDESIGSDLSSLAQVQRRFFEKFPDTPVIRLRVEAGEAYIAPTENMVHDGSTSDCPMPPYTFSLQGSFAF